MVIFSVTILDLNFERGAWISISSVGRSRNASYPISIAISLTISLNSLVPVVTSQRCVILCAMSGWSKIVTFFKKFSIEIYPFSIFKQFTPFFFS